MKSNLYSFVVVSITISMSLLLLWFTLSVAIGFWDLVLRLLSWISPILSQLANNKGRAKNKIMILSILFYMSNVPFTAYATLIWYIIYKIEFKNKLISLYFCLEWTFRFEFPPILFVPVSINAPYGLIWDIIPGRVFDCSFVFQVMIWFEIDSYMMIDKLIFSPWILFYLVSPFLIWSLRIFYNPCYALNQPFLL